ncbi:iron permease FTR1 [Exidia glandulosa HHB12029]|uniref:Iron permease FTR1 n=1 Tax=Exidia glandulosa HHB12029 TaxID=1314781 RepID=A0A165BL68_EXIGL|nr:iron permease FTR1 [Exidia glandulosa HHB12029]
MAKDLFSIPIFFIVFRETLEAAIILSVLLGIVDQLIYKNAVVALPTTAADGEVPPEAVPDLPVGWEKRLLRKLRIQIFAGALLGFFIALAIGAAFIAVWFTQASDLFGSAEELWEGVFDLVASIIIFVMGISMLRIDRAKAKWRVKLMHMFEGKDLDRSTRTSRWALFLLPFITVLREGLEAVVFVGGVSLGQQATSIPIAAIVGIICGVVAGYLIYAFASRTTLTVFLVFTTNFLLLIGAGLFSKAVGSFEANAFNRLTGGDAAEAGDGPGSFDLRGNVFHLNCCNPENKFDSNGWTIFAALFGWSNNGSLGTILSYVFYWLAVVAALVYMKFTEGRTTLLGRESKAGVARRERNATAGSTEKDASAGSDEASR